MIEIPFVRNPYNYDTVAAGNASSIPEYPPTLTQQHQAEEADINTIVRRFGITGTLPENIPMVTYADFDEVMDYHSAMNIIRAADESFSALPAETRARFQNDPHLFVGFCSDPANLEEARRLGLAPVPTAPPPPPPPPPAETPPTTL